MQSRCGHQDTFALVSTEHGWSHVLLLSVWSWSQQAFAVKASFFPEWGAQGRGSRHRFAAHPLLCFENGSEANCISRSYMNDHTASFPWAVFVTNCLSTASSSLLSEELLPGLNTGKEGRQRERQFIAGWHQSWRWPSVCLLEGGGLFFYDLFFSLSHTSISHNACLWTELRNGLHVPTLYDGCWGDRGSKAWSSF